MRGVTPDDWQLRVPPAALERRYLAEGWWTDDSLGTLLSEGLARGAGLDLRIHSATRPWSGTLGDGHDLARRLAAGLLARGVGPGDAVAFQLPNWVEAAATFWAVSLLGAVVVPIVHFYGPKEVGYILRRTRVRVLVTASRFGHVDYLANLDALRGDLPDLELVVLVGEDERGAPGGVVPFADLVAGDALDGPLAVDPSSPALVAYTSGTTSDPKGVVHAHRTIASEIRQLGAVQPGPDDPPPLVGAPVGHGIGMLAALLIPVYRGQAIHLIDAWDPRRWRATGSWRAAAPPSS